MRIKWYQAVAILAFGFLLGVTLLARVEGAPLQPSSVAQIIFGQYNASGVGLSDGNTAALQLGPSGELRTTDGGRATVAVPAATVANTIVKTSPGRIGRILITAVGTTAVVCYDNASVASGTIVAEVAASTAIGTIEDFSLPVSNGITCAGASTAPGYTLSFN